MTFLKEQFTSPTFQILVRWGLNLLSAFKKKVLSYELLSHKSSFHVCFVHWWSQAEVTSCNLRKWASIKSPHAGSLQAGGQKVHRPKQSTSQIGAVLQILWPSYAPTPLHFSDGCSWDYYCVAFILVYWATGQCIKQGCHCQIVTIHDYWSQKKFTVMMFCDKICPKMTLDE